MSTAVISYDSLMTSSGVAEKMAGYFNDYAESLRNDVLNKLNSYSGEHTENIGNAISRINNKLDELDKDSERFSKYGKDLSNLKDSCVRTDTMVKNKISSLSQTFCTNHNIRVSAVESTIAYLGVDFINNSPAGRFIGTVAGDAVGTLNSWKRDIEEWYDYEGGKQFVENMSGIIIDAGIIAGTVAITALTGGVTAPFIVAAVLNLANDCVDSYFEGAALGASMSGDPATGRRLSKINSFQDFSKSSVKYGYDFQNYEYGTKEKAWNIAGDVYDFTQKVADALDIGNRKFNKFSPGAGIDANLIKNWTSYFWDIRDEGNVDGRKIYDSLKHDEKYFIEHKDILLSDPAELLSNPSKLGDFINANAEIALKRTKFFGVRISDYQKFGNDIIDSYNDISDIANILNGTPIHGKLLGDDVTNIVNGDTDWKNIIKGNGDFGDIVKYAKGQDVSHGLNAINSFINE